MNIKLKNLAILIGDILIFFSSLYLTLFLRYFIFSDLNLFQVQRHFLNHLPHWLIVFLIFFFISYINQQYNLKLINQVKRFSRLMISSFLISAMFSALYFYLNVSTSIAPRTNLLIFFFIFLLLFFSYRQLIFYLLKRKSGVNKIIIIGDTILAEKLKNEIIKNPAHGYQVALVIDTNNHESLDKLTDFVLENNIKEIVFTGNLNNKTNIRNLLFSLLTANISFSSYPDFYEKITTKIPIEAINQDWFLTNLNEGYKNYYNFFKRFLDIFFSFLLLLITLPLWPIIALFIKLDSKGPIFFKQKRLGQKGQVFIIKKFRSMSTKNNDYSPTTQKDKRITKVGNWLRVTRLDELPQLLNILKGEMSFIGPRPERPEIVKELETEIPFYKTRLLIKPGLTGLDQVSGEYHSASVRDSLEKLQSDLFYIKNRSLYLDLIITLKTISTVISRKGR